MAMKSKGVSLDEMIARMPKPDQREVERRADALIAEHMALRDVRKAMGKTQALVARKLGVKQAHIARTEQRADMLISTLRGYVEALGGELTLNVKLPRIGMIQLSGLRDLMPAKKLPQRKTAAAAKRPQKVGSGPA
jgi:transcriptional regulator with XRE-family HTH domain